MSWVGGRFMKRKASAGRERQRWRAFHGFTPLKKNLICEITCGARLTPSVHVQATSKRASDVVMGDVHAAIQGLAGGPEDVVHLGLADDPLRARHSELAGNPPCGRR